MSGADRMPSRLDLVYGACDADPLARRAVAAYGRCPQWLLEILAEDEDPFVSAMVFCNPMCPPAVRRLLTPDLECAWARAGMTLDPKCARSVLQRRADDLHPCVRAAVAQHSRCPQQVLVKLAGDEDPDVRETVAANAACLATTLAPLAVDNDPYVRETALSNPNLSEEYRALAQLVS